METTVTLAAEFGPMRDPAGNRQRYQEYFALHDDSNLVAEYDTLALEYQTNFHFRRFSEDPAILLHQYGDGMPLAALREQVRQRTGRLRESVEFVRTGGAGRGTPMPAACALWGGERRQYAFVALSLLLAETESELGQFQQIAPAHGSSDYLFDLLIKSFIPSYQLDKKYGKVQFLGEWADPVLRALAQPPDQRAAALAAHMKNWCRIMRGYGWSPKLDTRPGKDPLFCDFAFEVALAVCAYDIDDSAFADHPYYPRDLVEHYRQHLRHTRDGWRAEGAGAGVPVTAPPPPKKADLAKSKRKGFARWVELACDGDTNAVESILETLGKLRKVSDVFELMEALAEQNAAISADIKDDDTLAAQAAELAQGRALPFDVPAGPPLGPARCTAILRALDQRSAEHGYTMFALDSGDDGWNAVLVRAPFADEFTALGSQLGVQTRAPAQAFAG